MMHAHAPEMGASASTAMEVESEQSLGSSDAESDGLVDTPIVSAQHSVNEKVNKYSSGMHVWRNA